MRKTNFFVAICALCVVSLAPVFAGGSREAASADPVTVDLWVPGAGEVEVPYLLIAERFKEDNPGTDAQLRTIPWSEYFTVLNTAFAGGVGPDVFGLGFGQLGPTLANGHLLGLDEYLADWDGWEDIAPAMLDAGSSDGKLYAVLFPDVRVMAFRRDLFENVGLDPYEPITSAEQLFDHATRLTVRDGERIAISGLDLRSAGFAEQEFFALMGLFGQYQLWDDNLDALLETEAAVQALTYMRSFFERGLTTYSADQELADGLAAMGFPASNAATNLENSFPGDIVWQPSPSGRAVALGTFFTVGSRSANPDIAVRLLKAILSAEGQMDIFKGQGLLPTRHSIRQEFIDLHPRNAVFFEGVQNGMTYGPINPHFFDFLAAVRPAIEKTVYGMAEPREALRQAVADYQRSRLE